MTKRRACIGLILILEASGMDARAQSTASLAAFTDSLYVTCHNEQNEGGTIYSDAYLESTCRCIASEIALSVTAQPDYKAGTQASQILNKLRARGVTQRIYERCANTNRDKAGGFRNIVRPGVDVNAKGLPSKLTNEMTQVCVAGLQSEKGLSPETRQLGANFCRCMTRSMGREFTLLEVDAFNQYSRYGGSSDPESLKKIDASWARKLNIAVSSCKQ